MLNMASALEQAAERFPEADAVITPAFRLTYREWNSRVQAVACMLRRLQVQAGDYVAICSGSGEAPLTMYFAALRAGAVAVLLNARWKEEGIRAALQETGARVVLFDAATQAEVRRAAAMLKEPPVLVAACDAGEKEKNVYSYAEWADGGKGLSPNGPDLAPGGGTILYTSGTTGRPKGVCRSPAADCTGTLGIILAHGWECFERVLAVMPLYHTMGLHTALSMVLLNGTLVMPETTDAGTLVRCLQEEKITALYLVPTLYHDLVNRPDIREAASAVRKLAYAGAPMSPPLAKQCLEVFQPAIFVNHYGCTEMLCLSVNRNAGENPLSAGRPGLFSTIRFAVPARDGGSRPSDALKPGEAGEIIACAASPQAFSSYFRQPEATAAAVRGGWYFTGDLGCRDEAGDLYLLGRVDDMIISGGENIYPNEVEAILAEHPAVRDVAVVGGPDARLGEIVTAFIVPDTAGVTAAELEEHCLKSAR
ncbi:MAG: acyl--CoA ligase, partial [Firmicutes bacterium]|nr:acyl--CoA ligase [Bacillota bacterium]